jgi:DNA polymerase III sliding clamp (beta) subunit (PCNA family)
MISIPSTVMKDALKKIGPAVDRRSPLKAFQSVRIRVSGVSFEMTAGAIDGQATYRAQIDGASAPIDVCVEADRLVPLVAVADDEIVLSPQKNGRVKFSTSSHTVTVPSIPGSEFPLIKSEGAVIADVDVVGLPDLISSVSFAAAPKDIRPYCQGVWLESDGEVFSANATDSKVMAAAQVPLAAAPFSLMLSVSACELIAAIDPDHIEITSSHLKARGNNVELIVCPVSAPKIDWRRLSPEPKNSIVFDGDALREAVSMHRHYGDKVGTVRFITEGAECTVEIDNVESKAESALDAKLGSDETSFNFSFSGSQLSKVLQHAPEEEVTIYWDAEKPRAFLIQNGNWRGVISPLIV